MLLCPVALCIGARLRNHACGLGSVCPLMCASLACAQEGAQTAVVIVFDAAYKDNLEEATWMTDHKDVSVAVLCNPWAYALVDKAKSLNGDPANVNSKNRTEHPLYKVLLSTGPRVYEVCVPFQPSRVLQSRKREGCVHFSRWQRMAQKRAGWMPLIC